MSEQRHLWRIEDGETHWYSAPTLFRALEMHIENTGEEVKETIAAISQVPDGDELTVGNLDDYSESATAAAAEWAKSKEGFIASTCW